MLSRACSLTSDRQQSTKAEGCVSVDMETASVAAVGGWQLCVILAARLGAAVAD